MWRSTSLWPLRGEVHYLIFGQSAAQLYVDWPVSGNIYVGFGSVSAGRDKASLFALAIC